MFQRAEKLNATLNPLPGFMTSMLDSGMQGLGSSPGWCHQGGTTWCSLALQTIFGRRSGSLIKKPQRRISRYPKVLCWSLSNISPNWFINKRLAVVDNAEFGHFSHVVVLRRTEKKSTKNYNAHAQIRLNLLFSVSLACRSVAVAVVISLIEWFSNRTGTSVEDARARGIVWTRLPVPRLTSRGQGHVAFATGN